MTKNTNITEKIIIFLSYIEPFIDYPKSFNQLLYWDKHQHFRKLSTLKAEQKRERERIKKALQRLEKANAITFNVQKKQYFLTLKGWMKYMHYHNKFQVKRNKKEKPSPPGHYVILFDIPEKHRAFRDVFRKCLQNMQCTLIQKSVFYTKDRNVFAFAQKIVANCDLNDYVCFIEAKKIII